MLFEGKSEKRACRDGRREAAFSGLGMAEGQRHATCLVPHHDSSKTLLVLRSLPGHRPYSAFLASFSTRPADTRPIMTVSERLVEKTTRPLATSQRPSRFSSSFLSSEPYIASTWSKPTNSQNCSASRTRPQRRTSRSQISLSSRRSPHSLFVSFASCRLCSLASRPDVVCISSCPSSNTSTPATTPRRSRSW